MHYSDLPSDITPNQEILSLPDNFNKENKVILDEANVSRNNKTQLVALPFFPPRVSMIMITCRFPKSRAILIYELHPSDPFCALPKIKSGYY